MLPALPLVLSTVPAVERGALSGYFPERERWSRCAHMSFSGNSFEVYTLGKGDSDAFTSSSFVYSSRGNN